MTTPRDTSFEEYWRRLFEYRASILDDDAGIAGWSTSGLGTRFRQFQRLWRERRGSVQPTGRWLDLGCGAGTYTRFLASQGLEVTAVDYSALTTQKARQRSPGDVLWAVADATRLPFATASMDGALCFGVMQALSSPHRALAELRRVLRPGGELWVDALNGRCLPNAMSAAWRRSRGKHLHLRYDTVPVFADALRAEGFDTIQVNWLPVLPDRLRFLQKAAEARVTRRLLDVPPFGTFASHSFVAAARARADTE
jgi:SAM-dependent methyltransferase